MFVPTVAIQPMTTFRRNASSHTFRGMSNVLLIMIGMMDGIEIIIGLNRRNRVHENGHSMVGGLNIWATMAAFPATYLIISKSKFRAGVCIRFHPPKSVLGALICHFYKCAVLRIGRCLLIVHHPEMS